MKKIVILTVCTVFCAGVFASCGTATGIDGTNTESTANTSVSANYDFTERELSDKYSTADASYIDLSSLEVAGKNVSVSEKKIRITGEGTFIVSGNNGDAMISVEANKTDKLQIVLQNVSLTNKNGPALYVKSADKVFVTLDSSTVNTLSDGENYSFSDAQGSADGTVFSRADIAFNGSGTLNVNGNYKHGIVSKDELSLAQGTFNIKSVKVGINGKDCVRIADGSFNIESGSDGMRSDNTDDALRGFIYIKGGNLDIKAAKDGIQAESAIRFDGGTLAADASDDAVKASGDISINGGKICISAANGGITAGGKVDFADGDMSILESREGIEGACVSISGGRISVNASDDGINATGEAGSQSFGRTRNGFAASGADVTVSGGYLFINANGDGIDSNGTLNFTGGITLISGPTDSDDGALDYETECNVDGGTVVALGASGMAEGFTSVENQGGIFTDIPSQKGGTSFALCDKEGNVIVSFTPPKAYQSVAVTAPGIVSGKSYTVVCGGTVTDTDENGYTENSSVSGGENIAEIEMVSNNCSSGRHGFGGDKRDGMPEYGMPQADDKMPPDDKMLRKPGGTQPA